MGKHTTAVNGAKYRNAPDSLVERLLTHREVSPEGCWLYTRYCNPDGYAEATYHDAERHSFHVFVHRLVYMRFAGDVDDDDQIDHTCHDPKVCLVPPKECPHRRCFNPAHLEPVSSAINNKRSGGLSAINGAKECCVRNHEFTPGNTHITPLGERRCKACARWHAANDRVAKRTAPLPVRICRGCGADIADLPGVVWYCETCEPVGRLTRLQQQWAEKRNAARSCLDCGTDISGRHLNCVRCKSCQKASIRQRNNLATREYKRKQRETAA